MSSSSNPIRDCSCPSCQSGDSSLVVSSLPPADGLGFDRLRESWFGFFKKKVFFSYYRCRSCGLLYSKSYFTNEALASLYSSMPDNTAGLASDHLYRTQAGYFDNLLGQDLPAGDYLELGPDIGLLTGYAAQKLVGRKMWLYEPNCAVHPELEKRLEKSTYEIRTEMLDFSAVPDGSVAVCVAVHVLDHLTELGKVVSQLVRKLRPGGVLLVVTHDESSGLASALGRRWPAYCLQHPHLFSRQSISKFMTSMGLEVVSCRRTVNHFPLFYLMKHLAYALGFERANKWKDGGPIIPLTLGNIATVARRIS